MHLACRMVAPVYCGCDASISGPSGRGIPVYCRWVGISNEVPTVIFRGSGIRIRHWVVGESLMDRSRNIPLRVTTANVIAPYEDRVTPATLQWLIVASCGERHKAVVQVGHTVAVRVRNNGLIVSIHRSEEHTSELQSRENLVCRLLLEK